MLQIKNVFDHGMLGDTRQDGLGENYGYLGIF